MVPIIALHFEGWHLLKYPIRLKLRSRNLLNILHAQIQKRLLNFTQINSQIYSKSIQIFNRR